MNTEYKYILLFVVQIITIYNALMLGCTVKKIGNNKYELTIKNDNLIKMNLNDFIHQIVLV